MFKLNAPYKPSGDQPKAIEEILRGYNSGLKKICLLGATGTGKTFTMANIISKLNIPTLVLSHNKTLASQLATEFKYFFPENAVHYFVSYFDYYQPESYIPEKDIYIEKDSTINKEIEMYRISALSSLLTRNDVIIVSSVSAIYGLGDKKTFEDQILILQVGNIYSIKDIKQKLIKMQYKPLTGKLEPGTFDIKGDILDILPSTEQIIYRIIFDEDEVLQIQIKDYEFKNLGNINKIYIWPATQFLQDMSNLEEILKKIEQELYERVDWFKKNGKLVEAERLLKRTLYDIRMIRETGFVNGIENYSPYFENRLNGEPPNSIFDYFPDEMLLIIDESHMTIPQLRAMPHGDYSRKKTLIDYGFRLPSAINHRPLYFEELEEIVGRKKYGKVENKIKNKCYTLFVSATPAEYELEISEKIAQQIIRPTGLLDPYTYIYPKSGDINTLLESLKKILEKKPYLKKYLEGFDKEITKEDLK